jgi:hypothetical protein
MIGMFAWICHLDRNGLLSTKRGVGGTFSGAANMQRPLENLGPQVPKQGPSRSAQGKAIEGPQRRMACFSVLHGISAAGLEAPPP